MRSPSKLLGILACLGLLVAVSPLRSAEEKKDDANGGAAKAQWGDIKGQVVWGDKTPPKVDDVKVDKDQAHCLKDGPIKKEEFIVNNKNLGVKNVFVWLIPSDPKKKSDTIPVHPKLKELAAKDVTIDQPCCQFIPHVVAVRQGQNLIVKNSSPINHNVNYQGPPVNPGDNVIIPAGKSINVTGLKTSTTPINVACNIHGWMRAYIRVFDHPYYAITDADGKFEIKDAPAGDFRIVMWHEGVGWVKGDKDGKPDKKGAPITIKARGVTDLEKVEMAPPKD
jgi:hypothetical protein